VKRDIIIVGGMTGWGKTLWTQTYTAFADRLLVFDPFKSFPNVAFDNSEGGLDDLLESLDEFDFLLEDQDKRTFRVGTSDPSEAHRLGAASFVLGNNLLVLEELSMIFDKGQRRLDEWASRLVFRGRHARCSMVVIAQRFMSVPIDIRSQANRIVSFNQHEPEDVKYLVETFGKEDACTIPSLPRFFCLDRFNNVTYKYSIKDKAERTLNIKLDNQDVGDYTAYYKSQPISEGG
jgi:hypothetical protein